MIVEGLVMVVVSVAGFIVSALGQASAPGWMTSLSGQMNQLVAAGASMGGWVPWSVFGTALTAVLAAAALSLAVRLVRIIVSLFTGGGGSAA